MIRDVFREKGNDVWTIDAEASVSAALHLMAEKNIGAVLVVGSSNAIEGIFSERDFARKMVSERRLPDSVPVREFMTTKVFYVRPEQTIEECMGIMTKRRFRHLPVMEEGRLKGVISIGDVVKALLSDKDSLIGQLEQYISGRA
jgi:CBS domain-containing protein